MNNNPFIKLEDIEYFSFSQNDIADRFIPLNPFYVDNKWEWYINTEKGFVLSEIVDLGDGFYISKKVAKSHDLYINFFNIMMKRNNFIKNKDALYHIYEDIYNLVASIEKINFFSGLYNTAEHFKLCKYASVELESIFQNSRAIFENLQIINDNLITNVKSINEDDIFTINKVRFGIKNGKNYRLASSSKEYEETYKIPELLASYYFSFQDFFFFILNIRNDIFHSREIFNNLYLNERGFSISLERNNLESLHFWDDKNTLPNQIGAQSLFPLDGVNLL